MRQNRISGKESAYVDQQKRNQDPQRIGKLGKHEHICYRLRANVFNVYNESLQIIGEQL